MNRLTIAQLVLGVKDEYLYYDFTARKARRRADSKEYINRNVCRRNLLDVKTVLDKHRVRFWLVYGTLLGAIRESDFIAHDTDTDLGIYEEDRERFIAALKDILGLGFQLIRTKAPDDLVTIMRADEYIDIGIFRREKDEKGKKYFVYQNNREYCPSFETLEPYTLFGSEFLIPDNTQKLLERWYGFGWNKPRPNAPAWAYDTSLMRKAISIFKSIMA